MKSYWQDTALFCELDIVNKFFIEVCELGD